MNSILPFEKGLPINKLTSCFKNTSATYKFYWLISILQSIEKREYEIDKKYLFASMIANSWFTVKYFHISFGQQDLIQKAVHKLSNYENITNNEKIHNIVTILMKSSNKETNSILKHFDSTVPHWFLSPWFPRQKDEKDTHRKTRIYLESQYFENDALYALNKDYIEINPKWRSYLFSNSKILKDYCLWHLTRFLQTRNPSVPDIPNKLVKPIERSSLTKQRSKYWDKVFDEIGELECIFSNKKINKSNYVLDHFIPHAFISHDLMWNLIPIDPTFNGIKSDKLPDVEKYFDKFFKIQNIGYRTLIELNPKNKLLDDYISIFPNISLTKNLDYEKYRQSIEPLIVIASNNGFNYLSKNE